MRKSFILHIDSLVILDEMTDEQAGKFLKSIYLYQRTNKLPELNFAMKMAITPFVNQFTRDDEKYDGIVERNKINGSKGGRPKNPENPVGYLGTQKTQANPNKPKKADSDSKSDNDNDNKNDSKKENKEYGEFKNVLLSDDEYQKLFNLYFDKLDEALETLSVWKKNKNKKTTHNYGTLLKSQWVYKKVFEEVNGKSLRPEKKDNIEKNDDVFKSFLSKKETE